MQGESKDPRQEERHLRAIYLKGYREGFQASQTMCSAMVLGNAEEIENEEVKHILRRLSEMLMA
jgi:hypothetical protein